MKAVGFYGFLIVVAILSIVQIADKSFSLDIRPGKYVPIIDFKWSLNQQFQHKEG